VSWNGPSFVIVIGRTPVSVRIARQLSEQGLRVHLTDSPPRPAATEGRPALKQWLEQVLATLSIRDSGREAGDLWLHPSDSLWAERAELVLVAEELGLRAIGPSLKTLALWGDRLTWFTRAQELGVKTLILEGEPSNSISELERRLRSRSLRFPLVLRSVRAGGRFGCKLVRSFEELEQEVPLWMEQHRLNLGEVLLFPERWLEGARRVSVPFCRFSDGRFHLFPETDISLASGFERLISFCPAENLDRSVLSRIRSWAKVLAEDSAYVGVGSFDFAIDHDRAFLIECTPRLSADFMAWEAAAQTRAIDWQLAALDSGWSDAPASVPLQDSSPCVLALQIKAENPILHLPQSGRVQEVSERWFWGVSGQAAGGPRAELIASVRAGERASGTIATLLVQAQDFKPATTLARGVLEETWIAGELQTNERFLHEVLSHPWVREGVFHGDFLEEEFIPALRPGVPLARLMASVAQELYPLNEGEEWVVGDRRCPIAGLEPVPWVGAPGSGQLQLPDGRKARVLASACERDPGRWVIRIGLWSLIVRPFRAGGPARVRAVAPGVVHSILFREGVDIPVRAHALVLESDGVLVAHALPRAARVERWRVKAGERVQAGDELAEVAPIG
jgi:pyruvate carboxylase